MILPKSILYAKPTSSLLCSTRTSKILGTVNLRARGKFSIKGKIPTQEVFVRYTLYYTTDNAFVNYGYATNPLLWVQLLMHKTKQYITLIIKCHMEKIDQKAKKMGLEKGYYLLLMAILDIPVNNEKDKGKED